MPVQVIPQSVPYNRFDPMQLFALLAGMPEQQARTELLKAQTSRMKRETELLPQELELRKQKMGAESGAELRAQAEEARKASLHPWNLAQKQAEAEMLMEDAKNKKGVLVMERATNQVKLKQGEMGLFTSGVTALTNMALTSPEDAIAARGEVEKLLPEELRVGLPSDGMLKRIRDEKLSPSEAISGIRLDVIKKFMGHGNTEAAGALLGMLYPNYFGGISRDYAFMSALAENSPAMGKYVEQLGGMLDSAASIITGSKEGKEGAQKAQDVRGMIEGMSIREKASLYTWLEQLLSGSK
jgi:hypothetical protein